MKQNVRVACIYSGYERHRLIKNILEVKLAGFDGFDVKC